MTIPNSYRQSRMVYLGKAEVPMRALEERVRQLMEGRDQKEIFLRGDASVQYQDLMDVIDMLKAAGVENIGMVSRMPSAR